MAQVRGEHQKTVGQRREHTTRDSRVAVRNRHHMAEVIVWCLKFQLPALVGRIRQHVKDRAQLGIAVAVEIHRSAIPRTHHGPGFLDMGHKAVIPA